MRRATYRAASCRGAGVPAARRTQPSQSVIASANLSEVTLGPTDHAEPCGRAPVTSRGVEPGRRIQVVLEGSTRRPGPPACLLALPLTMQVMRHRHASGLTRYRDAPALHAAGVQHLL